MFSRAEMEASMYSPGVFAPLAETELGTKLWKFLNGKDNIIRLETATLLSRPALEGVEEQLLTEFGEEIFEDRIKQMLGHMTRQVMENLGYVIDMQNVKMSGGLFTRATRYKRRDEQTYHVWRKSSDSRELAFTYDREGALLPRPDDYEWNYWTNFSGAIRGQIVFGLKDVAKARKDLEEQGFHTLRLERILRAREG